MYQLIIHVCGICCIFNKSATAAQPPQWKAIVTEVSEKFLFISISFLNLLTFVLGLNQV